MAKYRKSKNSYHHARQKKGSFAWIWLLTGMMLGILGVVYTYPLFQHGFSLASFKKYSSAKQNDSTAYNQKVLEQKVIIKKKEPNEHYEFYTMLPDMEVSVPKKPPVVTEKVVTEKKTNEVPIIVSAEPKNEYHKLDSHTLALIQKLKAQDMQSGESINHSKYQTPKKQIDKMAKLNKANKENLAKQKNLADKKNKADKANKAKLAQQESDNKLQKVPLIVNKTTTAQYLIQTGMYRSIKEADCLKARLALLGFNTKLQKIDAEDGLWFRVIMGPFANESLAVAEQKRLELQKIKGVLVMQRKLK